MRNFKKWLKRNKYFTAALSATIVMLIVICVALINSKTEDTRFYTSDNSTSSKVEENSTTAKDTTDDIATSDTPPETTDEKFSDTTIAEGNQNSNSETTAPEAETHIKPEDYPYLVKVNCAMNCVTVYKKDDKNQFTVPYRAFACSVGKNEGDTPLGTFQTSGKYEWCRMVDATYGQYAYRIDGPIMFHSVPSYRMSKDSLETDQFNKLGEAASLGCIRLNVRDAKWLFDNCPSGTTVEIYSDKSTPGPLGKPETMKIPEGHAYSGWDPFDPDPANPWNTMVPELKGVKNRTISTGKKFDPLSGVKALDSCLNDVTDKVKIQGEVNTNKSGKYEITYSITDLLGRSAEKTVTITVKGADIKETTKKTTTKKETTKKETTKKETTTKETTTKETTTKETTTKETTTKETTTKETTTEAEATTKAEEISFEEELSE